ncbi:hypothetical protein [Isoptericola rhizosphaerae]|uniref:hypothetical protein n=1 Tax=Isoptericola rhizosphaerae TaxID=3377837 RepID=UPI003839F3F7
MKTLKKFWTTAWSPQYVHYAMPATVVLVVLALIAALQVGPGVSAAWHRHREAKLLAWDPNSWALTVADFPEAAASEIPVDREWLGPWSRDPRDGTPRPPNDVVPLPSRVPPLRHLDSWSLRDAIDVGLHDGELTTSGVSVAGTGVVTSVMAADTWPYSTLTVGDLYWSMLQEDSHARDGHEISGFRAVGDRPREEPRDDLTFPWDEYGDRDPSAGVHGYAGFTTVESGPSGADARRVTIVMTIVDGALVLVGTSVPVDAEPAPEVEIPALLDRVAEKIHAAPPEISDGLGAHTEQASS